MGERKIEDIEGIKGSAAKNAARAEPVPVPVPVDVHEQPLKPAQAPDLVDVNYPDPTLLSIIVRDVAKWSGRNFVMEPGLNTRLQIFAPRKLTPQRAYDLFITSLSVVGLRAVQVGEVVKIVPVQAVVVA